MRSCILLCLLALPALAAPPRLTPTALNPDAPHAALTVPVAGRYTLTAQSAEGVALRLIDRMSGELARDGVAGTRDGRLDLFLDAGDYRLLVERAPKASGRIALAARHVAADGPEPQLVRFAQRQTTLVDGQARAWWIRVDEARVVTLEAAGRSLSTLQVWQDGRWLHATGPRCREVQPSVGQPIRRCTLTPRLPPGLHRVVAYGGQGLDWSEKGLAPDALHLRWGVPQLAPAGVRRVEVGSSGISRFHVPAGVAGARLSLALPGTATLRVAPWTPERLFQRTSGSGRIAQDARQHVTEVRRTQAPALIEIEAAPGTIGTLRWFPRQSTTQLEGPGHWRVGSVHADDDGVPVTGVLYRSEAGRSRIIAESVITVGPGQPLNRRFNLSATSEIFLRVAADMQLQATATGARLRLIPLWTQAPPDYRAPDLISQLDQQVAPGLYRLTLQPDRPGITELTVVGAGEAVPTAQTPTPTALAFDPVELGQGEQAFVLRADAPGTAEPYAIKLPVDLRGGMPLTLAPGQALSLPIQPGSGVAELIAATGERLALSADDGRQTDALTLNPSLDRVRVHNTLQRWVHAELRAATPPDMPLAPLSAADRAALPTPPLLKAGERVGHTLARNGQATWRLQVPAAGGYMAESTGLLATRGALRTATRLSVARTDAAVPLPTTRRHIPRRASSAQGSGRNFGIARYLRAGEYLLTVNALGQSAGRMGVRLQAAPLRDEGPLRMGRVARVQAAPGESVAYTVTLDAETKVRIESEGPAGHVRCRIEDADAWPIGKPEQRCERVHTLAAGAWRIILPPTRTGGLRRTRIIALNASERLTGAGPHVIGLGAAIKARWQEPPAGTERAPQVFRFAMPAQASVSLSAPDTMLMEIFAGSTRVARVSPGRTWNGALAAGDHTLHVQGARRDDGVDYAFRLESEALLPGLTRRVEVDSSKRTTVEMIIGVTGLYALSTDGSSDARIEVLSADGRLIDVADDRPDDWNARLTRRLEPGRYTVRIELADRYDSTRLSLTHALPTPGDPIALGEARTLTPTTTGTLLPLTGEGDLIAARLTAAENVGLALEAAQQAGWRTIASSEGRAPLIAARPGKGKLRLRIWSLDGLERPASLTVHALRPKAIAEAAWQRGATLPAQRISAVRPTVKPGGFIIAPTPGLLMCATVGAGCVDARPGGWPINADGAIFVGVGGQVRGRRVVADEADGPAFSVQTPAPLNLPRGRGPVLFKASAPIGQPAARIGEGPSAQVRGQALAVDLRGTAPTATVWSTDEQVLQLRARAWRLVAGETTALPSARTSVTVPPSMTRSLTVPAGDLRLRVVVPTDGAALLPRRNGPPVLAWGAHGPTVDSAHQVTGTVVLFNPTPRPAVFDLEPVRDARPAPPAIAMAQPFEARTVRSGVVRLAVESAPGAQLTVRGATARYRLSDGRVRWLRDGDRTPVEAGGTLVIRHGVGPVLAWIGDAQRPGPWATSVDTAAIPVDGDRHLSLSGDAQAFTMNGAPRMLHLRLAGDAVLRVEPTGGAAQVLLGGAHDVWLPDGAARVTARGLGGGPLAAQLLISSSRPQALTEGVGEPVLLAPGDTRVYRFETTRKAAIGVGIRADADRVQASVYNMRGERIARGGSVMPKLTAGAWLLALHLPADAAPVQARPTLVGIAPRGDQPPPATVRKYVENAR